MCFLLNLRFAVSMNDLEHTFETSVYVNPVHEHNVIVTIIHDKGSIIRQNLNDTTTVH